MSNNTYKHILKTSGLIGFVQIIRMSFGIINSKILAVFIGANGYGIYGMYQSFISMATTFSALGVTQSGVRDIAKNVSNQEAVSKCIWIFRRIIFLTSLIASLISIFFSKAISKSLFDTENYYVGVIIVSTTILFDGISSGQTSILNGLRHITELAKSQIIGIVIGSIATVSAVILLREKGIPFYLFAISLSTIATTWWYVRKLNVKTIRPCNVEIKNGIKSLIMLGLGFSITGIVFSIITYISRIFLLSNFGLKGVGIYMSSWTLSNLYVGIILSAMGVDFMPRIMAKINDNKITNRMINEQMELGVLISGIGVVGMIIFSQLILTIFYSNEFISGTSIIRWQVLGVALRVLSYPLGYVIMGKNRVMIYVLVQTGFYVGEFLLLVLAAKLWGFKALGVNYFIAYAIYTIVLLVLMNKMIGLKFSNLLNRLLITEWGFIIIAFVLTSVFSGWLLFSLGGILMLIMTLRANYTLSKHMDLNIISIITSKINNVQK